jgi:hypothetical protein
VTITPIATDATITADGNSGTVENNSIAILRDTNTQE